LFCKNQKYPLNASPATYFVDEEALEEESENRGELFVPLLFLKTNNYQVNPSPWVNLATRSI
jgi:hypothetical protein